MVNPEKFIIIPSHARTTYNLSGNELIAYGLIFGFSQDEKSWFVGGLQYVADWCGLSSKIRAKEVLQRLIDKGCIRKRETEVDRNIKKCDYQAILPVSETDSPYLKERRGVSEKDTVVSERDTNNIDSSIKDNIVVEDNHSSRTINSTSNNNSSSTPKNAKKGFEEKFDLSFVSVHFEESFKKWLRYKQERGEMYKTQMTLEENYRRLLTMANNDPWMAQKIVDYTISGGWMGYCMPKQNQQNYGSSSTNTTSRAQQLAAELKRQGYQF